MTRLIEIFLAAIGGFIQYVFISRHPGAALGRWLFSHKVLAILIPLIIIVMITYFWIALSGPRMHTQPHILTYQIIHALPPENAVTVKNSLWPINDSAISSQSDTSLIKSGKTYYNYYCVFCHGEIGKKTGPVGRSFVPTPPDLAISKDLLSDSALIRKLVFSTSHNPLIPYVVSPDHRLAIARYVRSLR
jgi:mono/diheme cytochrome c family protein